MSLRNTPQVNKHNHTVQYRPSRESSKGSHKPSDSSRGRSHFQAQMVHLLRQCFIYKVGNEGEVQGNEEDYEDNGCLGRPKFYLILHTENTFECFAYYLPEKNELHALVHIKPQKGFVLRTSGKSARSSSA